MRWCHQKDLIRFFYLQLCLLLPNPKHVLDESNLKKEIIPLSQLAAENSRFPDIIYNGQTYISLYRVASLLKIVENIIKFEKM